MQPVGTRGARPSNTREVSGDPSEVCSTDDLFSCHCSTASHACGVAALYAAQAAPSRRAGVSVHADDDRLTRVPGVAGQRTSRGRDGVGLRHRSGGVGVATL